MPELFSSNNSLKIHTRSKSFPFLQQSSDASYASSIQLSLAGPFDECALIPPTAVHSSTLSTRLNDKLPPLKTYGLEAFGSYVDIQDPPISSHAHIASTQSSPTKSKEPKLPTLVSERPDRSVKAKTKTGVKIASWFNGESNPMNFTIVPSPTKEKLEVLANMVNEASSTSSESKRPTFHQTFSRLNLFSSKPTPTLTLEKPQRPLTVDLNDEWLTLDVHNALFSSGDGSPDPCSSTAVMKSQLQNAETLLSKLQIAYKARTQFLHEVIAEKEAQDEEVEVAQTRARHLKIQLDDTTQKMAEQDRAIMNLVDELAREKQARREEDDARKRSVLLIHNSAVSFTAAGDAHAAQQKLRTASNISYESSVSEDEVSLLFSPAPTASPTVSTASVSTMNSPELRHTSIDSPCPQQISQLQPVRMRPSLRVQSNNNSSKQRSPLGGQWKCYSCAEAWSVVEVLKSENQGLKERVEHLEGELDGCLDLVNGLVETTEAAPAKG